MDAPVQAPTVSVVILNHRRPNLLQRALTAITQQDYPAFEIVVVGDQPDLTSYGLPSHLNEQVRYTAFTEPNICQARNLAVRASGGEIIAFIDDDAAPEPSWLTELVKPFADPKVATVGGTVRASDGISLEWQGGTFDRTGRETEMSLKADITTQTAKEQLETGQFLSLRGVNSAFRREALIQTGGFDEAIRYYLDETDMALRLTKAGWSAAIAKRAEVHHLLVPNASRGLRKRPGNQHEIGAGKAVFCAKHSGDNAPSALADFRRKRIATLDPQMRLGLLRTTDRNRVEAELEAGMRDGLRRTSHHPLTDADRPPTFLRFAPTTAGPALNIAMITGWSIATTRSIQTFARKLALAGHAVSLFSFRSGFRPPSVTFRDGIWRHSGGTWLQPFLRNGTTTIARHARAKAEINRIAHVRRFDVTLEIERAPAAHSIELPGCRQKLTMLVADHNSIKAAEALALLQCVAAQDETAQKPGKRSMSTANETSFPASAPAT